LRELSAVDDLLLFGTGPGLLGELAHLWPGLRSLEEQVALLTSVGTLTRLVLDGNKDVDDETVMSLTRLTRLQSLGIADLDLVTDAAVAELQVLPALCKLDVSSTWISGFTLVWLHVLTELTAVGCADLSALRLPIGLKRLNLAIEVLNVVGCRGVDLFDVDLKSLKQLFADATRGDQTRVREHFKGVDVTVRIFSD
jgi:hypothetical protein